MTKVYLLETADANNPLRYVIAHDDGRQEELPIEKNAAAELGFRIARALQFSLKQSSPTAPSSPEPASPPED